MSEPRPISVDSEDFPLLKNLALRQEWEDKLQIRHIIIDMQKVLLYTRRVVYISPERNPHPERTVDEDKRLSPVVDTWVKKAFYEQMVFFIPEGTPSIIEMEEAAEKKEQLHQKFGDMFEVEEDQGTAAQHN